MKQLRIPANPRRARGFSLIEMIAAFLVFAIGIGVLMEILATSMHSARKSSDYTMAALWAQSKLDTVGVGEPLEAGQSNGRFDDNYTWDLDVQQVDPAAVEPPPQASLAGNPGRAGEQQNAGNVKGVSASNAGLGGGIDVAPFDLYRIDLTVSWGGNFSGDQHHARFSTLRVANPDADNPQGGPIKATAPRGPAVR